MLSFWAKLLNAPLPQLTTKFASLGLEPSIFPAVQRACSTRVHNGNNKPMQTNTSSSSNSSRDAGIHDSIKEHNYNNQQDVDKLEYDDYQDYQDSHEAQEGMIDKQQLLRQLIRQTHLAEAAMVQVMAGQQLLLCNRPDATFFTHQEGEALEAVKGLLPKYRVRPSLLLSALQAAGLVAGAAAALAPAAGRDAVVGALQGSLTDLYNDQLRTLRDMGLTDEAPDLRAVLRRLRDLERAAEGAPPPPDLISLSKVESLADVGVTGVVGAVVKAMADAVVGVSSKI